MSDQKISRDEWYALASSDPQAAEDAYRNGKVEGLSPDVVEQLQATTAWNDVLGALRSTFDGAEAEVPDDGRPVPKGQATERPLPDEPMDWGQWKRLGSRDPRHAQRVWNAGLVDVPAHLREELA